MKIYFESNPKNSCKNSIAYEDIDDEPALYQWKDDPDCYLLIIGKDCRIYLSDGGSVEPLDVDAWNGTYWIKINRNVKISLE